MGGTCNMREGDEKCRQNVRRKTWKKEGNIILKWILKNRLWVYELDSSGSGQALINIVMNVRVP